MFMYEKFIQREKMRQIAIFLVGEKNVEINQVLVKRKLIPGKK